MAKDWMVIRFRKQADGRKVIPVVHFDRDEEQARSEARNWFSIGDDVLIVKVIERIEHDYDPR